MIKLKSRRKFDNMLGKQFCHCSDAEAPDYTPMAEASEESARIMGQLGQDQLDFSKQQYAENKPILDKVVQQQLDIADQTQAQGEDYFNYLKTFRPAEQAMMSEAMQDRSGEIADFDAANQADAATITQDDAALYAARKGEIDQLVNEAVADTQGSYTRSLNQAIRQGLRYGASGAGITSQVGAIGLNQASQTAAATNAARKYGINSVRERAAKGINLRQTNMGQKNAQEAIGWAKKLDAAGLVKGLPGASSGAYSVAVNAGNSAGQNAMAPGQTAQSGMAAGASTVASGRSLYQNGLGSILNSQTQMAMNDGGDDILGGLGALAGGAAKMYSAGMFSDSRLKEDIVQVGHTAHGLPLYEFKYIMDDSGDRYRGVMAQEVEQVMPEAVMYSPEGWASVDYNMLGIEMEKV